MIVWLLKSLTDVSWYLAMITPLFWVVPGAGQFFLAAVPAAWCGNLFLQWRKQDFGASIPDTFLFELRVLGVVSFFELFIVGISGWQRMCAPFAAAFGVFGIWLLRMIRIEESGQRDKKFLGLNGLYVAVVSAAAAILASPGVTGAVKLVFGSFYQGIFLPLLVLFFGAVGRLFMAFWERFGHLFPKLHEVVFYGDQLALDTRTGLEGEAAGNSDFPEIFRYLGMALTALFIFLILRYVYRRLSDAAGRRRRVNAGAMERSGLSGSRRKKGQEPFLGGERNVRYYYRKFLKLCAEQGVYTDEGYVTTDSVYRAVRRSGNTSHWPEEALLELRDLYRVARYGREPGGLEPAEERRRAKEIYKELKNRKD